MFGVTIQRAASHAEIFRGGRMRFTVALGNFMWFTTYFFCGDERYVALALIGDLAKRNFAEKHHII